MGRGLSERRKPFSAGGREFIIAIDDDGYEEVAGRLSVVFRDWAGPPIRYVRASTLQDPNGEADLWLGAYTPSAPDRSKLFFTEAQEIYEQDAAGLVYKNGELAWDLPPVSYGNPRSKVEGKLTVYQEAALFFSRPRPEGGHDTRVRTIGRLLDLNAEPRTASGWKPSDWLERAHQSMRPFGPDLRERLGLE